jgi:threonine/homoserine/homoserine lactone efflux protein
MTAYIIFGLTYGFIAGVQPGPFQTYIISQTLKRGWKHTLPASLAPVISDGPIFILAVFILSTIPEDFLYVIRIFGGIFLIYLAFNTYRSWKSFNPNQKLEVVSKNRTLLNAVFVNLLNPNPYLGWSLIMGPLFLEGWNTMPIYGISLIVSFYITLVLFIAITIFVFAFTRILGPKVSKTLLGLSSIALLGFGLYQLFVGIKYLG